MQNERTLRFWDDYHCENDEKEWILQPTNELIKQIALHVPQFPTVQSSKVGNDAIKGTTRTRNNIDDVNSLPPPHHPKKPLRILEIGCGTSTLARDLWLHLTGSGMNGLGDRSGQSGQDRPYFVGGRRRAVQVCATDVSEICVKINQQRDHHLIEKLESSNGDDSHFDDILEYRVLNILQEEQRQQQQQGDNEKEEIACSHSGDDADETKKQERQEGWDVILDKGCLDTFLFRSRQRGENGVYTNLLQSVLDNIHRLLNDQHSVYIQITPRAKIRAVRDYAGFQSVHRHALPLDVVRAAETVSSNAGSLSTEQENRSNVAGIQIGEMMRKTLVKQQEPSQDDIGDTSINNDNGNGSPMNKNSRNKKKNKVEKHYMYVCHKNTDNYVVGVTPPFPLSYRQLPSDDTKCRNCHVSFGEYRKGENVNGRGVVFWTREWKNHCLHCKVPHKPHYN